MKGAFIKIRREESKTIIEWFYNGKLDLKPKIFEVSPALKELHEEQSYAMAAILPLIAMANEEIIFEGPVARNVVDFWRSKMKSLQPFYNSSMDFDISPISDDLIESKRGDEVGLFMGCGADSLSTLGTLLESGIKPHLVLIEEKQHKECFDNNLRNRLIHKLAKDYGLPLTIVNSNLWFWGLESLHKSLLKRPCQEILNRSYIRLANANLVRGFKMFFAALAGLPLSVGKIIMGCSKEDRSEWFGLGFNYENDLSYIDIALEIIAWEKKVDQYDYLHNVKPELLKYQKTCTSPYTQWCGKCNSCHLSRHMQLAVGAKSIIKASQKKKF